MGNQSSNQIMPNCITKITNNSDHHIEDSDYHTEDSDHHIEDSDDTIEDSNNFHNIIHNNIIHNNNIERRDNYKLSICENCCLM